MAQQTINLKKRRDEEEEEDIEQEEVEEMIISWTAHEYEQKEHSSRWYLIAGGIALFFVLFGILAKSYIFIVLVIFAFLLILMYAKRTPQLISFAITGHGVHTGNTYHPFSQLTSFHILGHSGELSLETKKHFHPFLRVPISDEIHQDDIREFLLDFLPEKEHPLFFSDEIARRIGIYVFALRSTKQELR